MYRLLIDRDARNDLANLPGDVAVVMAALLQQLKAEPALLERLTEDRFGGSHRDQASFQVRKWVQQWEKGIDLWRLKAWKLERQEKLYRVIYFYEIPATYHVLAIVQKTNPGNPHDDASFDYQPDHPVTQRVLGRCKELGLI